MSSRFSVRGEVRRHNRAFTDSADEWGTSVLWFRYNAAATTVDDVYDDPSFGTTLAWHEPRPVMCMNLIAQQGAEVKGEGGFYTTDSFYGTFSAEHLRRAGLPDLDLSVFADRSLLKDRIVYDGILWSPTALRFAAHVIDYDLVFGLAAEEIDPDEVVNDPLFAQYVRQPS